jgi:dihydrofolate reductase
MILSHIAAISKNLAIGANGDLPWHIPEDLKYFKDKTRGHIILMGRKSFDSLGIHKPLPKRLNVVVTRDKNFQHEGAVVFHDVPSAIAFCETQIGEWPEEIFICGGAEIYTQTLPIVDRLYLTHIDAEVKGDAFYPSWDKTKFKLVSSDPREGNPSYKFNVYERI